MTVSIYTNKSNTAKYFLSVLRATFINNTTVYIIQINSNINTATGNPELHEFGSGWRIGIITCIRKKLKMQYNAKKNADLGCLLIIFTD